MPTCKADFSNKDAVLAEMAAELAEEPEDLFIDKDRGASSFRVGTAYKVEVGVREYVVVEDSDVEREKKNENLRKISIE